jgi:hypothetical protein
LGGGTTEARLETGLTASGVDEDPVDEEVDRTVLMDEPSRTTLFLGLAAAVGAVVMRRNKLGSSVDPCD